MCICEITEYEEKSSAGKHRQKHEDLGSEVLGQALPFPVLWLGSIRWEPEMLGAGQ